MTHFSAPRIPVTVGAAVRRDDTILFVRGTYGDFKNVWTLPSGFVDPGEMPEIAAAREVLEEGGIVCAVEGVINLTTIIWRDAPMLYLVFLANYISGEPTPDRIETDGALFLSLDDLNGDRVIDGQNAFLARLVLTGQAKVLLPTESRRWNDMYRTSWA